MADPVNADLAYALASAPAPARSALQALWSADDAFAHVLATVREPMIRRIRLAWWREALERLDREPAPAEPVLQRVQHDLVPLVSGARLAALEDAWAPLTDQGPLQERALGRYASRGALLFEVAAEVLRRPGSGVAEAGELWALVDLARHSIDPGEVAAALAAARARSAPRRWPRPLRPIGMIAALASRDLARGPEHWEEPGIPPRTARMLRMKLTGW